MFINIHLMISKLFCASNEKNKCSNNIYNLPIFDVIIKLLIKQNADNTDIKNLDLR